MHVTNVKIIEELLSNFRQVARNLSILATVQADFGDQFNYIIIIIVVIVIIIATIEISPGGSSPYTTTDKQIRYKIYINEKIKT
jgi:hypothetical protein